jgi:hypothetical protein
VSLVKMKGKERSIIFSVGEFSEIVLPPSAILFWLLAECGMD